MFLVGMRSALCDQDAEIVISHQFYFTAFVASYTSKVSNAENAFSISSPLPSFVSSMLFQGLINLRTLQIPNAWRADSTSAKLKKTQYVI